jgi:hypothetical protein
MENVSVYLIMVIPTALAVLYLVSVWKVFEKAGHPGWACLIPIYNVYIVLQIAGKPGWWLLLFLIPGVNIVIDIIVLIEFAKSFGQTAGFGVGLTFLGIVFMPILAFGDAKYVGPRT